MRGIRALEEAYLRGCQAIGAVDFRGPEGWINPAHYQYLALQLRRYVLLNMAGVDDPDAFSPARSGTCGCLQNSMLPLRERCKMRPVGPQDFNCPAACLPFGGASAL